MPFFFAVAIIFGLILFVPALAVTARRLHDTGRSGWWQLTAYIPYVGFIASIILIVSSFILHLAPGNGLNALI